jgi:hypothetical protein
MKNNRVTALMIWLNFCEINGHIRSAEIARKQLAEAMAPVVTAHPVSAVAEAA